MAYWLSLHVSYSCRHAGACCTSGWPIPLERERLPAIASAIERRTIDAPEPWLLPVLNQPSDIAGVLAEYDHRCVFYQSALPAPPAHRCAVQTALGHGAIPVACQHFPRVCLIDDRGVFVTLSHYCPTAASLLDSYEGPITIAEGPDPIPNGAPEGFDARGAWPPLLVPNVLMDLAAYSQWEAHVIAWLGGERNPDGRFAPENALHLLNQQARRLASWRPGQVTLAETIACFAAETPAAAIRPPDWNHERRLRLAALAALHPSQPWGPEVSDIERLWSRYLADAWRANARLVNRVLAAHAFAAWSAYQADGLVSGLRQLDVTLAVLRNEAARVAQNEGGVLTRAGLLQAIRQTDLLLVHLVNREALVSELAAFEDASEIDPRRAQHPGTDEPL